METTEQVEQRLCYCHQETIGGVLCNVISAGCKLHGVRSNFYERSGHAPLEGQAEAPEGRGGKAANAARGRMMPALEPRIAAVERTETA